MATGAFDSANSSVNASGGTITLRWDDPGGDAWAGAYTIGTPSTAISLLVDEDGPNERTITGTNLNGSVTKVSTDLSATFNLSGFIEAGESVTITLTASLITDASGDVTGAASAGTSITNSSAFVRLASRDDLKTYLGVSGTDDDDALARYLKVAANLIERAFGRKKGEFLSQTVTETLDGKGSPKLYLSRWPITSITSVKRVLSDGTTSTINSSDYRFESETGELELINDDDLYYFGPVTLSSPDRRVFGRPEFGRGFRNVEVVYVGGYTPPTMDECLQQAAIEIAGWLYRRQGVDTRMQSESLGDYSYTAGDLEKVSGSFAMFRNAVKATVIA